MNKEKLIINEGINSRLIGLTVSSFLIILYLLFFIISILNLLGYSDNVFKSYSVTCIGKETIIDRINIKKYKTTHNIKDLPRNCRIQKENINLLSIFLITTPILFFFLSFFSRYKKIELKSSVLIIHDGNVYFYKSDSLPIDDIKSIRIFAFQKKLLILPYKVIALEFNTISKKVIYTTNNAVSSIKNTNMPIINKIKNEFLNIKSDLSFVDEVSVT